MTEMFRVTKEYGFMIILNQLPGNPKKHFSYVKDRETYDNWLEMSEFDNHEIRYHGYIPYTTGETNEWLIFLEKVGK